MRRRAFLVLLAGVGAPVVSGAQTGSRLPLIGFITPHDSPNAPLLRAFRDRLRELGYVEGETVRIEYGFAVGDLQRMPELAARMARRPVDVLVTDGGPTPARAAKQATSTIPIIGATLGGDPVGDGLVESVSRPGGNLTGFTTAATDVAAKRLEYMKVAIPALRRIGVIWNARNSLVPPDLTVQAAEVLGMQGTRIPLDLGLDIAAQIASAASLDVDALVLVPDGALFHRRADVVAAVIRAGVPAIYPEREYVEAGGLMSYGPVIAENFRGAADYVAKVLRGAKVEDLPVQDPTRLEFVVNRRAAHKLGLQLSDAVLIRADEVIE